MMIAQTLEVYAAASLKEAFTTIAHSFEASNPGVIVHLQFAGSQALAAQISNGAPADVFASADSRNLDRIAYDPLMRKVFATNRLVVVSSGHKFDLKGLSSAQKIVLAAPAVPVGGYSRTTLKEASSKFGSMWLTAINSHVVSEEADVRAVLTKVQLGEADAGIVYASDAISAGKGVFVSPVAKEFQPKIEYPVAVPKESTKPKLAQKFVQFLLSRIGKRVLANQGFGAR